MAALGQKGDLTQIEDTEIILQLQGIKIEELKEISNESLIAESFGGAFDIF